MTKAAAVTEPDRLVFFIQGAHADNSTDFEEHLKASSSAPCRGPHEGSVRDGSIFDSLARLLVSGEKRGQVFAVAVAPDTDLARIIIAENTEVPPAVRNHLACILESLYTARQLVRNLYPTEGHRSRPPGLVLPIPIPRDTTDPLLRKLLELELSVFRHSWPKLRKRFTKADRDVVFVDICSAILSPDPDKRLPLDVLEQDELTVLSESDRKQLAHIRYVVSEIRKVIVPSTAPSDDVIHRMRVLSAGMAKNLRDMEGRKEPLLPKFASYAWALKKPGTDFKKWANKALYVHSDFVSIARTVSSPRMDRIVTERIMLDIVRQDPLPATVDVTADNLHAALGCPQYFDTKLLQEFLRRKCRKLVVDQQVQIDGRIHCECAVLAKLDELRCAGVPVIPYVGVSKPSCSLCNAYFEAYRKITYQDVKTRQGQGTHSRSIPWRCPTLADQAVDEQVRSELSATLRSLLVNKLVDFKDRIWWDAFIPSVEDSFEELMSRYGDVDLY